LLYLFALALLLLLELPELLLLELPDAGKFSNEDTTDLTSRVKSLFIFSAIMAFVQNNLTARVFSIFVLFLLPFPVR
jgi:hypothetical protein